MAYLQPADYPNYGLPAATTADWITGATALINSYCRRADLNVTEYTERIRMMRDAQTVRLSYLPLAPMGAATSPLVSVQGRYARPRRGELAGYPLYDIAWAFSLPGQWVAVDVDTVDFDPLGGELTLPMNLFGIAFNELSVTYTAGLSTIGDDVKTACAQIVRNAQATPALNASHSRVDTMQLQYFSSSLLDDTVKQWLRPYVASKVG
ncbi:hypothetical protein DYQ86_26605 [Acidobacteria bacterium AB60]|nr:hypothetical protein DYQ86_26605 [Acidobacteria bacterium AB60]